ncbi:MAG: T9SS type A sorting domain-containing protein [Chitinophagaceae bacterium]|nr:T9SS type A sorting domain-containing protein [Chitinophagaceae bacterium]
MFDNQTAGIKIMENIVKTGLKIPYSSSPDYKSGLTGEPPRVAFETPLSEFHLYPNPTTNAITVSFENLDDKQHYHISVSDVIGKVLWMNAINASKGKIILNCSKFADGIYFISINEMETPVWCTKFIKLK